MKKQKIDLHQPAGRSEHSVQAWKKDRERRVKAKPYRLDSKTIVYCTSDEQFERYKQRLAESEMRYKKGGMYEGAN